jgi:nucleoside-diphosphate-sugar epimerase
VRAGFSETASGAFNIASATRITINGLWRTLCSIGGGVPVEYGPPRPGDVRHSLADIRAAQAAFGYRPKVGLDEGLREYMEWMAADPLSTPEEGGRA